MKLTKSKLRQLIKEELTGVLEEQESKVKRLLKQIFGELEDLGYARADAFAKAKDLVKNAPAGAAAPGLKFEEMILEDLEEEENWPDPEGFEGQRHDVWVASKKEEREAAKAERAQHGEATREDLGYDEEYWAELSRWAQ